MLISSRGEFFFFELQFALFSYSYITSWKKQQTEMRITEGRKKSGCGSLKLKISILIKCTSSKTRFFFPNCVYVYSRVRFEEE